jgi:hypothetical protein
MRTAKRRANETVRAFWSRSTTVTLPLPARAAPETVGRAVFSGGAAAAVPVTVNVSTASAATGIRLEVMRCSFGRSKEPCPRRPVVDLESGRF